MKFSRHVLAVATAAACLGLSACHHGTSATDQPAQVSQPSLQHAQDALSQPAWLRDHLPAQTVAYLRIPSPWAVIGAVPDGRPLDVVTAGEQNLKAIAALRDAIGKDKLLADSGITPYLVPLLVDLRSPLEAAMIDPIGVMSPRSQVLLSMRLSQTTTTAVNARFAALGNPRPQLSTPLDAQGNGKLANGAPIHFDAAHQRLWMLLSLHPADASRLTELIAETAKPSASQSVMQAMKTQEQAIDPSGEGLFGWISVHGVGAAATSAIPAHSVGQLPGDLLSKVDSVAFGAGSVNGHGRLQLRLHAPQSRLLGYLAPQQFDPSFKVAGTPHWVASMALPGHAQWQQFENNLTLDFGAERAAKWHAAMGKMKDRAGFDIDDLTRWVGPELISFADDAGSYVALRVRDRKALDTHLEDLAKRLHWRYQVEKLDGIEIHTLVITHASKPADTTRATALNQLVARIGTHLYWVEDGDYLIFSKVPQALADRAAAHPDTSLASWLKSHDYDGEHTLAGITAVTHDAERSTYYSYLQLMQIIDDLAGDPVDLMTMPAANTLNLPRTGIAGASIGVSTDTLSLSLNYQQQPLELIGAAGNGSGMTAIAGTAILAAIAIPAYQNYIIRTQTSEGLALSRGVEAAMIRYHEKHDRWPNNNDQAQLPPANQVHGRYVDSVNVAADGQIIIHFGTLPPTQANAALAGKTLVLKAVSGPQQWSWQCSSSEIAAKYLPASCRAN